MDAVPETRVFVDQDGIEWAVRWCSPGAVRKWIRDDDDPSQGLVFTSSAVVFHVPLRYDIDPLLLTNSQLNSMVELAFAPHRDPPR